MAQSSEAVACTKNRFAFLDVARCLAALVVLFEHGIAGCVPAYRESASGHGWLGKAGVILFLIISGYLIPASLEQGGSNTRFWLRRFFRLYPAYWLSIGLALVLCWQTGVFDPVNQSMAKLTVPGDWLLNLTMVQRFFKRPEVWGVFWTLQIELIIYAICSLLFATKLLRHGVLLAFAVLGVYLVIGLGRPLIEHKPYDIGGNRMLYIAAMTGFIAHRATFGGLGKRVLAAWCIGWICVLGIVWSVNSALFPDRIHASTLIELLCTYGAAIAGFFVLSATRDLHFPNLLSWLGRISYSIYLLHPFVLEILIPTHWHPAIFLPILLAATVVLSALSFRFVESPGIALGRQLEKRWLPRVQST